VIIWFNQLAHIDELQGIFSVGIKRQNMSAFASRGIARSKTIAFWEKRKNFERRTTRHTKPEKFDFQKLDLFLKTRELSMDKAH